MVLDIVFLRDSEGSITGFYEVPKEYDVFSASSGVLARMIANKRGLVAVYLGRSRRSIWGDLNPRDYLAVPRSLAFELACGALIPLGALEPEDKDAVLTLLDRGRARIVRIGEAKYAFMEDEGLRADILRQLNRVQKMEFSVLSAALAGARAAWR